MQAQRWRHVGMQVACRRGGLVGAGMQTRAGGGAGGSSGVRGQWREQRHAGLQQCGGKWHAGGEVARKRGCRWHVGGAVGGAASAARGVGAGTGRHAGMY